MISDTMVGMFLLVAALLLWSCRNPRTFCIVDNVNIVFATLDAPSTSNTGKIIAPVTADNAEESSTAINAVTDPTSANSELAAAQTLVTQVPAVAAAPAAVTNSDGKLDFPAVFLLVCMYQGGLSKRHSDEQSQRGCAVTLRTFLLVNGYAKIVLISTDSESVPPGVKEL